MQVEGLTTGEKQLLSDIGGGAFPKISSVNLLDAVKFQEYSRQLKQMAINESDIFEDTDFPEQMYNDRHGEDQSSDTYVDEFNDQEDDESVSEEEETSMDPDTPRPAVNNDDFTDAGSEDFPENPPARSELQADSNSLSRLNNNELQRLQTIVQGGDLGRILKGQSLTDFVRQGGLHSLFPREGKPGILDSEESYEIDNYRSAGDVSRLFAPRLDAPREASKGRISLSSIKEEAKEDAFMTTEETVKEDAFMTLHCDEFAFHFQEMALQVKLTKPLPDFRKVIQTPRERILSDLTLIQFHDDQIEPLSELAYPELPFSVDVSAYLPEVETFKHAFVALVSPEYTDVFPGHIRRHTGDICFQMHSSAYVFVYGSNEDNYDFIIACFDDRIVAAAYNCASLEMMDKELLTDILNLKNAARTHGAILTNIVLPKSVSIHLTTSSSIDMYNTLFTKQLDLSSGVCFETLLDFHAAEVDSFRLFRSDFEIEIDFNSNVRSTHLPVTPLTFFVHSNPLYTRFAGCCIDSCPDQFTFQLRPGARPHRAYVCHCSTCMRMGSNTPMIWVEVYKNDIAHFSGNLRATRLSPKGSRQYCATCGLAVCKILDESDSVAFNAGCLKDTYIHRSVFTNQHLEELDVGNSGIFVCHAWTKNLSSYNNLYPNLSEKHLEDIPSTITPHIRFSQIMHQFDMEYEADNILVEKSPPSIEAEVATLKSIPESNISLVDQNDMPLENAGGKCRLLKEGTCCLS